VVTFIVKRVLELFVGRAYDLQRTLYLPLYTVIKSVFVENDPRIIMLSSLNIVVEWPAFLCCALEVSGRSFGSETDHLRLFCGFCQCLEANACNST
jgi:hypothetical protein